MGEELNDNKNNPIDKKIDSLPLNQDMPNSNFGEIYQDLNDFKETKLKIEELIKFKQSLIDLEESDFTKNSEKFRDYKLKAIDAINNLFDECQPKDPKEDENIS